MKLRKRIATILFVVIAVLLTAKAAFGDVILNEMMINPANGDEWVELHNTGNADVNISGWTLNDTLANPSVIHTVAAGKTLTAGGYYVANVSNVLNNDGDTVVLKDAAGATKDNKTYVAANVEQGKSFARVHDGNATWIVSSEPTQNAANNQLPAGNIPNQELKEVLKEEVKLNLSTIFTDADNDPLTYTVKEANHVSCSVSGAELTVGLSTIDESKGNCTVTVNDGFSQTDKKFDVTIVPALEVKTATLKIKVGNKEFGINDDLNVTPGDEVTVSFDYKNNIGNIIGYLAVDAHTDPNFFNYHKEDWFLADDGSDSFKFTVPHAVDNSFDLEITLNDEIADGTNIVSPELILNFTVNKNDKAVHIKNATLLDDTLTCSQHLDLKLELVNSGKFDLQPEVWIFNAEGVTNPDTKEVESAAATFSYHLEAGDLGTIAPQASSSVTHTIKNLTGLNEGDELFIYVVNPFFWDGVDAIGDEAKVKVTKISDCLDDDALEDEFELIENYALSTSVDLFEKDDDGKYVYLIEDKNYESSLTFEIVEQTNSDLVSCSVAGSTLTCAAPAQNENGENKVTLKITNGVSSFNDTFEVEVHEAEADNLGTLSFTSVSVKGKSGETLQKDGISVKPLETFDIQFTVKNNLNEKVTGAQFFFFDEGAFLDFSDVKVGFALEPAQSKTQTVSYTIPVGAAADTYDMGVGVMGASQNDNFQYTDVFEFPLEVVKNPAEILVEASLPDDHETTLTCSTEAEVDINITNIGQVAEDDMVIKVRSGSDVLYEVGKGEPFQVKSGDVLKHTAKFNINKAGTHTLVAEVGFNHDINGVPGDVASATVSQSITKNSCLSTEFTPKETTLTVADNEKVSFTVKVGEAGFEKSVEWLVNDQSKQNGVTSFDFTFVEAKEHNVTARIGKGDDAEAISWKVTVTDKPVDLAGFGFTSEITDVKKVENFFVQKNDAKIAFKEAVDLSDIGKVEDVVKLQKVSSEKRIVAVDSANAPALNKKAEVTLSNFPEGTTFIYKYNAFGDSLGAKANCVETNQCKILSHTGNTLVFEVDGFSTYEVVNEKNVSLSAPSEIVFNDVTRGQNATTTFTVSNAGTLEVLGGMTFDHSGIPAEYAVKLTNQPAKLDPQQSVTVTMEVAVPEDEDAGKQHIGSLVITGDKDNATIPVYVVPRSFLTIEKVEINGKTSGDFLLDEDNEIKVEVKNEYTEDMEDVEVEVKILDVDNDDLEESEDIGDLDEGDDDTVTVTFDLAGEEIDEESYKIEVTVKGEATDGTEHEAVFEKTVDVDIEKHKVILERVNLVSNQLQCIKQTSLQIDVKNVGKSDEDEVRVTVTNGALGLSLEKDNIDLRKFSKSDNDDRVTFNLNLENAAPGTYPLEIEVFRDGTKSQDSQTVTLTVKDCVTSQSAAQAQQLASQQAAAQAQAALQQQLQAQQFAPPTSTTTSGTTSFRESSTYLIMLAVLAVLVFIALVLAIGVAVTRKKR